MTLLNNKIRPMNSNEYVEEENNTSTPFCQTPLRRTSPISKISMERKRLEQTKGRLQQDIKTSIHTIERKISKYNIQIKSLEEQKVRLMQEYNKDVPHEHRLRGSTPEETNQKQNEDNILKEQLANMCKTMHQMNQFNNMSDYDRKVYESSKPSNICTIL